LFSLSYGPMFQDYKPIIPFQSHGR
jgi:hypothetical protein